MKFLVFSLILSCLLSILVAGAAKSEDELIQEYLEELEESNYDRRIAPEGTGGKGKPLKVSASMYILDISNVDEFNMDFNAQFYFRQSWVDPRLQFSDKNISDVTLRSVEKIWTPDLFFTEEREGTLHKVIQPNIFCKIKPDGQVTYSVRISGTFICGMDLRKYPHDTQKCTMHIESYGFQKKDIDLEWSKAVNEPLGVTDNITVMDFDLIEVTPSTRDIALSSGEYSALQVHLTFKRRIGYFATRLFLPSAILVVLSWLTLWIKTGQRCLRLALLLVVMYLMITVSSEANISMPPAHYIKASDVWIGFSMSLVLGVFLEFIVVSLMSKTDDKEDSVKTEILANLDPEAKEQNLSTDSLKSPLRKLINMIDARNGGKRRTNLLPNRIDRISRILFPIIYVIFNIVYWSVYCTA